MILFKKTEEQFEYRKNAILKILAEYNIGICSLCAVVGRGGILNPVESGAYRINDRMLEALYDCPKDNASRLGAFLAAEIAKMACVPAYVFDSVAVDEMWELTRLTGLPGIERSSIGHETVDIPASKIKKSIAGILTEEGYISGFDVLEDDKQGTIRVKMKYGPNNEKVISGIKKISKPGLKVYAKASDVPKVLGGLGIAIISTSNGVISDKEARKLGVGGEVICYVW